ncbi:MAG: two-component system LytT family response regulator [Flavobacteriales bacterium]|jgi:two-component system LytT family response regulator
MKLIIIDDEPLALQSTKIIITENCPEVEIVGVADNIREGQKLIVQKNPDLVLCDIEMPGGTGFDLLDLFHAPKFQVVFITAFDNYAVKAFQYSAIDYLLKPFPSKSLVDVINKARNNKNNHESHIQLKALAENNEKLNTLVITGHDKVHSLNLEDLNFLEADSNYTKIFVSNGTDEILCSKTLKNFEDQLPGPDFFRVHHSYIIGRKHIQFFSPKTACVTLQGGYEIGVSQRRMKAFLDWLG